MRFTYLELENYIGIYNGMGLYNIQIDFLKAKHRICVIKGTNGSGKTTIQSALSLFPDGNESFIPDKPARKVVRVMKDNDIYEIKFYHDLRPSGGRIPTKAFISKKTADGNEVELNPNGNVTSYRDILYEEFRLDTNFFALTRLSMDDRGLGYKKPAERKKFVNSIIESLEVYNDIYKIISKKANNIKAVMNNITSRLGAIGDKASIVSLKDDLESSIQTLQTRRDEINGKIAAINATITNADPDNYIQESYRETIKALDQVKGLLKKLITGYQSENKLFIPEVETKLLGDKLDKYYHDITYFEQEAEKLRSAARAIIDQMSSLRSQLDLTISQLESLKTDEYIETEKELEKSKARAQEIAQDIAVTGIDPMAFTKSEYITALETVHDIVNMVNVFRSTFDYNMIQTCISEYANLGYVGFPDMLRCDEETQFISTSQETQQRFLQQIAEAENDVKFVERIELRPSECRMDNCYFVADAIKVAKTNPVERLKNLNIQYQEFIEKLKKAYERKEYVETHNQCLNQVRTIIRSIDNNNQILIRLPNGGIFNSKQEFFEYLVGGQSFEFIDRLYQYINVANYFEIYQGLMQTIKQYEIRLESLSSQKESMRKFEEVRQSLQRSLDDLSTRLMCNSNVLKDVEKALESAKNYAKHLNEVVIPRCDQIIDGINKRNQYQEDLKELQDKMDLISNYIDMRTQLYGELKSLDTEIAYKQKEKDDAVYKLRQIDEYETSLAKYKDEYERYYEKIRYHSSPTTGIQLVFMQLYMGKILDFSNKLLSYLFGGQYQLQPFIINEDEFRIPCIGNGYLNDDISSMSSSQLTMISMILSFALMSVSSTDYNVIKLDEIDDPLDEPNRAAFAILLDNIMDVMHTEQCIMISHSSEMITNNADIILLRSDGLVSVDPSSNIIWNFNNAIT